MDSFPRQTLSAYSIETETFITDYELRIEENS